MNQPPNIITNATTFSAFPWATEQPDARRVRPANRTELVQALEANEVFLSFAEWLPDHSRSGINE